MYFYTHLRSTRARLGASPLSAAEEKSFLTYFGSPLIAEFQPEIADGLWKMLDGYGIQLGTPKPDGSINFTTKPKTVGQPTAMTVAQGYLSQSHAVLLQKNAPVIVGQGTMLNGVFSSNPDSIRTMAAKDGKFAIVRPYTLPVAPAPSKPTTGGDSTWIWVAGISLVFVGGIMLLGARRSSVPN
jgi:hypothetical protein